MVGRAEDSAWAGRTGWLGKQAKRRKEAGDHHQTRVSSVLLPRINSLILANVPLLGVSAVNFPGEVPSSKARWRTCFFEEY